MSTKRRATARRRPATYAVPGLLAVATLLRLAYLFQNRRSPFFEHPIIDGAEYVARARAILADGLLWDQVPIHAPLYPTMVAGVFAATGGSFFALYALQHLLGIATLFLVYRITRHAFGSTAAIVALGLGALTWAPIYYEGQPLSEPLVVFLLAATVLLLLRADERGTWRAGAAAGAVLGLAVITRANVLALLPLAAIWLATGAGRRGARVAAFLGAAAVIVAPVTIQNYRAEGEFVLVQANGGFNFYLANHDGADAGHTLRPGIAWRRVLREGERTAEGPGSRDRYWTRRGLGYIVGHPLHTAVLVGKRLLLFLEDAESGTSQDPAWHRANFPALRWAPLGAGWATALALLGLVLRRRPPAGRPGRLLALLMVGSVASLLFFPYFSRYRYPSLPLWWAFAGAGVVVFRDAWRSAGRTGAPARRAALVALLIGVLGLTLFDPFRLQAAPSVRIEYQLGRVAGERGDAATAIAHYRRALEEWPEDPDILNNLGLVLDLIGRSDEARVQYEKVLAEAPDHVEARINLAALDLDAGRTEEAFRGYERAVHDDPRKFEALVALGTLCLERGLVDDALPLFRRAFRLRSADRYVADILGRLLLSAQRLDEAREHYRRLAGKRSTQSIGLTGLARFEADAGRFDRAEEMAREATRIDPDDEGARALLEQLRNHRTSRPGG